MPKSLTTAQVAAYRRDGYVFPLSGFSEQEMAEYRRRLFELEAKEGGKLSKRTNQKPHLLLPWLNKMIRDPRILDAVEDVLGPNLLAWSSGFFYKRAHDPSYISWHQDSTYWGLSSPDVMTAWVAFTPSTVDNGCMRVVPGSHLTQLSHTETYAEDNMLSRGQEVEARVDEKDAVDIILKPGHFSLHHVQIIHGSEPNRSDRPRIGYTIRYIPTHVRQLSPVRDNATLVRGVDEFHHYDLDPVPEREFEPAMVRYHDEVLERATRILYAGAKKVREYEPLKAM